MPKSIFDAFETSADREKGEGLVLNYGSLGKIRIHRAGGSNQRFANYYQSRMKPYTRQVQNDTMDEDVARDIAIDVYAKTVVIGWEGLIDKEGNEIPFSEDNCRDLFKRLPDLFRDVQAAATDRSLFLADAHRAAEGN